MRLHPDQPIQHPREDILGRKVLSRNIAKALVNWKSEQSLVFALNGSWGSGKSSVKNLVAGYLRASKRPPVIVDFNPWEMSGHHALTEELFAVIGEAIAGQVKGVEAEDCARRLTTWGNRLQKIGKAGRMTATMLRSIALLSGEYAPAVGVIAAGAERAAEAAERSAEISREGADLAKPGENEKQPLAEQKTELAQKLAALGRPIIVMVDDIDRLTADEICLLFRLIKANCDFPGFAFVLLFDRPYVCSALDRLTNDCGAEFLEKIVQVSMAVGQPDREVIRTALRREVLAALPACAKRMPLWDEERWNVIADYYLVENIRHLRDLRRLVNAFTVSLGAFTSRRACEVNPIDLLALEHLRLSEPALYESLAQHRWLLVGENNHLSHLLRSGEISDANAGFVFGHLGVGSEAKPHIQQEYFDQILAPIPPESRKRLSLLLDLLFPACHAFKQTVRSMPNIASLRVGHSATFDVYFHRAVPMRNISQQAIEKTIQVASNEATFLEALRKYLREGRHSLLLEHLTARAGSVAVHGDSVLFALMQFAEELTAAEPDWWWNYDRAEIVRLFSASLLAMPDSEARWQRIQRLLERAPVIRLLFVFGADETKPDRRSKFGPEERVVPDANLDAFRNGLSQCASKLMWSATQSGHRDLLWLLYRWRDFSDMEKVREWLRERLSDPKRVSQILRACAGRATSNGVVVCEYAWTPEDMARLLPRDEWQAVMESAKPVIRDRWEFDVLENFSRLLSRVPNRWVPQSEAQQ